MIVAVYAFLALLTVPTFEQDLQSGTPISPCPEVFMYEPPGGEQGRWYGVIHLSTDSNLHSLWLNIVLDSKADIIGNWIGDVTTQDNKDFKIENPDYKIKPGPATLVRFFVQYNPLNRAPRLVSIRLNGRDICDANTPRPSDDGPNSPNRPPVEEYNGSRPVYVPPVHEPNPSSISGGGDSSQSLSRPGNNNNNVNLLTTQRPVHYTTRRPEISDFSDPVRNDDDDQGDYFGGGQPALIPIPNRPGNTKPSRGDQGPQCGKVVLNNPIPLVVNGTPTLEGQWPWHIALYQTQTVDSKYICGGTLVGDRHIITAAHCVTRKGSRRVVDKHTLTVFLGKHNLRTSVDGVQIKFVDKITVHPDYNATIFSRDLAILELRDRVSYSNWVRPVCLWLENEIDVKNIIGKKGSVVGWGADDKGLATEELMLVEMPVVDELTCIKSYFNFFSRLASDYSYCAGFRDGTSVCNGDSGGGMVFKNGGNWYLRGLVSASVPRQGEYRCDPTHYVIFTDLAKFLPWIKQNISN